MPSAGRFNESVSNYALLAPLSERVGKQSDFSLYALHGVSTQIPHSDAFIRASGSPPYSNALYRVFVLIPHPNALGRAFESVGKQLCAPPTII